MSFVTYVVTKTAVNPSRRSTAICRKTETKNAHEFISKAYITHCDSTAIRLR